MTFISPFAVNEDGYNESAFIDGVRGVHGPLRIRFRPTPLIDRSNTIERIRKEAATGEVGKAEKILAVAMTPQLLSWEFLDDLGQPVDGIPAPSLQGLLNLKPQLFNKIASIVFYGDNGGDVDPDTGKKPDAGKDRLEDDQKN